MRTIRQVMITALGLFVVSGSAAVVAMPAPELRADLRLTSALTSEPTSASASVITLCGLAVVLVLQDRGEPATLFAGEAMAAKLQELEISPASAEHYELADVYTPVAASCGGITAEHDDIIRTRATGKTAH